MSNRNKSFSSERPGAKEHLLKRGIKGYDPVLYVEPTIWQKLWKWVRGKAYRLWRKLYRIYEWPIRKVQMFKDKREWKHKLAIYKQTNQFPYTPEEEAEQNKINATILKRQYIVHPGWPQFKGKKLRAWFKPVTSKEEDFNSIK